MLAVDTNVLVRYLINDEPSQGKAARHLIEHAYERNEQVHIGPVVLVETVWVLESVYRFSRDDICAVVEDILAHEAFAVQHREQVVRSLEAFRVGKADFADYFSATNAVSAAQSKLHTFDRACKEKELFVRL